ncbi:MAG: methyltransferase domain-containing protein, partial [bacterium]
MRLQELHQGLLSDQSAQQAFQQAISQTVQRGETVLDLGTGTGIHALFACQAGASRVYAVDQNPAILELARRVARGQGFDDRIVFLDRPADEVDLPQPVDVLITHQGFFQQLELI